MSRSPKRRCGFTMVELLVVIGIIGLLMAILMPALSGVKKRSRKAAELNNIRQVYFAWSAYAAANDSAAVPGYLDPTGTPNVIEKWDLFFEFPNHVTIPPEVAAPWTWRLMQYLDYSHEIIHAYREEDDPSLDNMIAEASLVANEPAFGYNGYYTGGWWTMTLLDPTTAPVPVPRFYDAKDIDDGHQLSVVVKSLGQIQRQTDYIAFCSAGLRGPGDYKKTLDTDPGSFLVTPPNLAEEPQWQAMRRPNNAADRIVDAITALAAQSYIPIGRYTGAAAILYADGHTNSQKPGTLEDARMWINVAETREFTHTEF